MHTRTTGGAPSADHASQQNIGYGDHLQHRYWHFIDRPFSTDGTPLIQPQSPNAQTQIEAFTTAIRSVDTSDDIKSYDVAWLEHLVGDVDQPLHATSRFSADLPNGDRGGNSVAVKPSCAQKCPNELHAVWDNEMGTSKDPSIAIAAADKLPGAPPDEAAIIDPSAWIEESFETAQQLVYAPDLPGVCRTS